MTNTEENYTHVMSSLDYLLSLEAAIATFSLHIHARVASLVGRGFYTIGPCGEEMLSSAAMALTKNDSTALHYRHTAISMARQWRERKIANKNSGDDDSILDDLLLARARGYTASKYDPVTGGVHCSIGGGPNEYVVTSTLSSQCPSAVGRALGYALLDDDKLYEQQDSSRPISFATLGDGSLHNHHFLSSLTLARHAKHLKIKCPMVFGISNNGLSISYETKNYVDTVFSTEDPLLPVFRANGQDLLSVYDQSQQACDYARHYQSPCVIIYTNLVRRFGHAATDRQSAYLDSLTIDAMADTCVLQNAMTQAVEQLNLTTYSELQDRWEEIHYSKIDQAFAQAMQEPKVTLDDMVKKVSAPLANLTPAKAQQDGLVTLAVHQGQQDENESSSPPKKEKPQVMRKQMTRVLDELLEQDASVVYLGEDVRHGGYYLVTEDLAAKHPTRIVDFPPDETTLLGAALGFSQLGLLPIVEIPYAKYLDCGVDMFYEIAIQHWLTTASSPEEEAGNKTANPKGGMIIRLQGFDRGVFGGNFHTHNMLSHMPPGVDVVCYSNGHDYVQGMRHAYDQAIAGRIVMLVDCTHLLNLRHVHDRDRGWEFPYPTKSNNSDGDEEVQDDLLGFDQVRVYKASPGDEVKEEEEDTSANTATTSINTEHTKTVVVSYGNGVVASLQARKGLVDRGILPQESDLDILDCPYLSGLPLGLEEALQEYSHVVFADICKEGPGSNVFSSMIVALQERQSLPPNWCFVGAPRTYNPLGSTVTFLNCDMIEEAVIGLLQKKTTAASAIGVVTQLPNLEC